MTNTDRLECLLELALKKAKRDFLILKRANTSLQVIVPGTNSLELALLTPAEKGAYEEDSEDRWQLQINIGVDVLRKPGRVVYPRLSIGCAIARVVDVAKLTLPTMA